MKYFFINPSVKGNVMRIMVVVGVIAITSVLLSFVTNSASNEGSQFLTMKVIETQSELKSFIVIVDENGKQETIELESTFYKRTSFANNVVIINKTLNKIGEKGYKLVSHSQSGGGDRYQIFTTYTFVKQ